MDILNLLTDNIKGLHKATALVGIDGGQGSGKSTVIKELMDYLSSNSNYKIISLETDDFLAVRSKRENLTNEFFTKQENLKKLFDFERMAKVIKQFQLAKNETITLSGLYNTLSGEKDRIKEYVFGDKNIIIIGGPYLLEDSYPNFDIKIFLYATEKNRLQNTLIRTLAKKRSIESQKELFNKFECFYKPYFVNRLSGYNIFIDNNDFNRRKIITLDEVFD